MTPTATMESAGHPRGDAARGLATPTAPVGSREPKRRVAVRGRHGGGPVQSVLIAMLRQTTGLPVRSLHPLVSGQQHRVWRLFLTGAADVSVVLRVALTGDSGSLAGEARLHRHLHEHGIGCPLVLPGRYGQQVLRVTAGSGRTYPALLLSFVSGAHPQRSGDWWRVGQVLARLHALDPPAGMRPGPQRPAAALDRVRLPEPVRRAADQRLLRIPADVDGWDGPVTVGLCHGDPAPSNVLIERSSAFVLDLERARVGWTLYDLAIAMFGATAHTAEDSRGRAAANELLAGYRSGRALSAAEVELLPLLAAHVGVHEARWRFQTPPGYRRPPSWRRCLALAARWQAGRLDPPTTRPGRRYRHGHR
jgi:Ser/Thr protein kinase RdoA (MazF antagonist)